MEKTVKFCLSINSADSTYKKKVGKNYRELLVRNENRNKCNKTSLLKETTQEFNMVSRI